MSKLCLLFIGVNKAERSDRLSYYPHGFRNPYKTIDQRRKLKFGE